MKGRIPEPLALKLLKGNRRRRPVNPDEPLITVGAPPKPNGLNRIESAYWNTLVKTLMQRQTLHAGMGGILLVACSYYWQFMTARAACKQSTVYKTRSREGAVVWKAKPEAALMSQAAKGLTNCLEHLGLTPASAGRTHALPLPTKEERGGIESYFQNTPSA
jgi:phage terminase small subunit